MVRQSPRATGTVEISADKSAAANQVTQQMAQAQMGNPMGGAEDPDKLFNAEAENLEVVEHYYLLDGVEDRLLERFAMS